MVRACSGSGDDPVSQHIASAISGLRFRLEAWCWTRARRRRDNRPDVRDGPGLPCDLGKPHHLSGGKSRPSGDRYDHLGAPACNCAICQSALDAGDGVRPGDCGVVPLLALDQSGHASVGLCGLHPRTLVFADNAALHRYRTASPTEEAHRQVSVLAALLAPAIGQRAIRSAQGLLEEFGSISAFAKAPAPAIARALGDDGLLAAMLIAGREIFQAGMREQVLCSPIDAADPALYDYLIARFAGQQTEQLAVLFLDQQRRLLSEESFISASVDCVSLKPRVLFSRALALGSRAIILAHNHPSGDPTPSAKDIGTTARIAADSAWLDIEFVDHLVVAGSCVVSMKKAGLL